MSASDDRSSAPAGTERRDQRRRWLAAAGILIGAGCLWLVWRYVDLGEAWSILRRSDAKLVAVAAAIYWLAVWARVLRWHRLLTPIGALRKTQVAQALIVGYAANYLLPARLGEPARAEYTQRRFGIDRISAFGTIVTERVLDGLMTVFLLGLGLLLTYTAERAQALSVLLLATGLGIVLFGGIALVLILTRRLDARLAGPDWFISRLRRFTDGAARLDTAALGIVSAWTSLIWLLELLALFMLVKSLGLALEPAEMLVLLGGATLSVLIPTAPAFIGNLQLAFAFILSVYGYSAAAGVAAATLVQTVFYGSLVVVAASLTGRELFTILVRRRG